MCPSQSASSELDKTHSQLNETRNSEATLAHHSKIAFIYSGTMSKWRLQEHLKSWRQSPFKHHTEFIYVQQHPSPQRSWASSWERWSFSYFQSQQQKDGCEQRQLKRRGYKEGKREKYIGEPTGIRGQKHFILLLFLRNELRDFLE